MKKILIGIAILVIVVVAVALAAPFFIPAEVYKSQLVAQVKAATGRDLRIEGPVRVSLLPRIALEAEKVSFSNAPGAAEKEMATLAKLQVQLQVLPLLSGEVAIDRFVLMAPVIHLETDKKGHPNWVFENAGAASAPQSAPPKTASTKSAAAQIQELRLGEVKIQDGRITYLDQRSNARYEVSDVDVAVKLPSLDQPVNVDGALVWNSKRVQILASADRARALIDNSPTPISLKLAAEPVSLSVAGTLAIPAVSGDIELKVPSVRALAAWTGSPLQVPGTGLGPFSLTGKFTADNGRYAFANARLALDEIKGTGEVQVDATQARPQIVAKLAVDGLDLNPYLGPEGETAPSGGAKPAAPAPGGAPAPGASGAGWSEEPIDLAALHLADADLDLSATGIRFRKIAIDKGLLGVKLKDGHLDADLRDLELYKGKGTGKIAVEDAKGSPHVALAFKLDGIQAEPLLHDAAGFDRLSGTGALDFDINGAGKSQRAIVASLGGKGAITFTNGAIKGINLAAMVRNVTSAFDLSSAGAEKTDFAELGGTFTIAQGILTNNDLALQSPLLRVEGAGKVDLPNRSVDYRVTPKAVASLEGQGGRADLAGIMVPINVRGPWNNLSYQPDLGAAIQQLKDPGALLEKIPGMKPPAQSGTTQQGAPTAPNPKDLLRGLLNKK